MTYYTKLRRILYHITWFQFKLNLCWLIYLDPLFDMNYAKYIQLGDLSIYTIYSTREMMTWSAFKMSLKVIILWWQHVYDWVCNACISDPIFPLTFLVNSWVPGMFDGLFQASFLSALLLFWLCIYHGVRQVGSQMFNNEEISQYLYLIPANYLWDIWCDI